jgi:putative membrane protein
MRHVLSDAEMSEITEGVAQLERGTAGELVVLICERCDDYIGERLTLGVATMLLLSLLVYGVLPEAPAIWVLCGQGPVLAAVVLALSQPSLTRWIVPRSRQVEAVRSRARQLFVEFGVTETRDRSGVLLLLSETERRIELLADRGIHERVGAEAWQRTVDAVVDSIRKRRARAGLLSAVESIGALLSEHFPPRANDSNELPDAVKRV